MNIQYGHYSYILQATFYLKKTVIHKFILYRYVVDLSTLLTAEPDVNH